MEQLGEIICCKNLNINGKTFYREAVRGIIANDRRLLMIFSRVNGDYKFPGGGVESGETFEEALAREIREETGFWGTVVTRPYGTVLEYDVAIESEYDLFKMTSYYYLCRLEGDKCDLDLDLYEQALGFEPVWIDVSAAIQANRAILADPSRHHPRWTRREILVLELLSQEIP